MIDDSDARDAVLVLRFDGAGHAVPGSLEDAAPESGFTWIHLRRSAPEARAWLETASGLDPFIVEALTAEDTRPRCSAHKDGTVLILRGVNLNPGAEPEDMISVRLWVEAGRVIGLWRQPLKAVDDLIEAIGRGAAPVSPGDLVARLALRLADRIEPTVTDLNESLDDLEERVAEDTTSGVRSELSDLRRQAIWLRRYIAPQRDALTTLAIEDVSWLSDRDRLRVREAADRTIRVAEELDAARERASVIHDELMDRRAERMNRSTLLLSVVASIFLPLSLVAGLLGMNVEGIPFDDNPWTFAAICAAMPVIGALQYAVYRWAKWV